MTVQKSQALLSRAIEGGLEFLRGIVTGAETWLYLYQPETKQQSSAWAATQEEREAKPKQDRYCRKVMVLVFFDSEGIVYHRYLAQGQRVTTDVYVDVLKNVVDAVRKKRLEHVPRGWTLLHDNARVHTSAKVRSFIQRNNIKVLDHPAYSPDLSPCDYFLFSRLKLPLRGGRFGTCNELTHARDEALKDLSKNGYLFVLERLRELWQLCIEKGGEYL